jgi:EAL domain-containing protein (putative c-di-GMP-specific phosphodiesterase class I)
MEAALRQALREGEFELHYQPILGVGDGRVRHVEALVRWHHPARGLVLPSEFMPIAEETGLARDVGRWVLEVASRQAAAWRQAGLAGFTVSVNLSASQLREATVATEIGAILAGAGCSPGWLTLEITETSMVKDVEGVGLALGKLRRLGLRVAIDDFGTGFSSLSHLRHMPVDALKIDKSFVADIGTAGRGSGGGGAEIAAAVTGLAKGLGLEVVAEGVEKSTQLDFLRAHGCDAYQGYFACRPLPAAELTQWLEKHEGARAARPKAPARKPGTRRSPKSPPAAPPRPKGKRSTRK